MPMSVEDVNHGHAIVGERPEDSDAAAPIFDLSASDHQSREMPTDRHSERRFAANEARQLPSPSISPPPQSLSPKLVIPPTLSPDSDEHNSSKPPQTAKVPSSRSSKDEIVSPYVSASKIVPRDELHHAPVDRMGKLGRLSMSKVNGDVLKLSAAEMEELTSTPESLPIASPVRSPYSTHPSLAASPIFDHRESIPENRMSGEVHYGSLPHKNSIGFEPLTSGSNAAGERRPSIEKLPANIPPNVITRRPGVSSRSPAQSMSNNLAASYKRDRSRQRSPRRRSVPNSARPDHLDTDISLKSLPNGPNTSSALRPPPSPIPQSIPLPPMSIPTYLQLELSSSRPSPLYIYRSVNSDTPYESSKIKFERLLNFLLLPPQLEQVLYFGSLACLDAWLYTFTILPLRFFKALAVLIQWWGQVLAKEARFILGFIYHGAGRFWHRQRGRSDSVDSSARSRSASQARQTGTSRISSYQPQPHSGRAAENVAGNSVPDSAYSEPAPRPSRQGWGRRHRRMKSHPSSLSSNHKADLLQGAVIICSCLILMRFDASRMYHSIRGQAAIKLYVIYNVLEVCDKLFSALGQDIFECLFSNETLDRDTDGRSKILRPLGMFILALIYNVIHAAALFYQVVTLNVAVNSYSNALLTLLMSNQFVEIKSTVFKMFQKDNIFQLTCADIVERFQLWLMLTIIALRNIVEVGGLSIVAGDGGAADLMQDAAASIKSNSILPNSFTILPSWSGEVLSPFLLVLGSEMLVDWVKHAYIGKFNRVNPAVYQRYLDVLAKDYYTNAFINQNLIKRLGLPVIPLSCLFIRSSVQTYHMFLATHVPPPLTSTATALSVESATSSPATRAALEHFDNIIRRALGRSTFGIPHPTTAGRWYLPSADDVIAALTMLIFFLGAFFVLLALKLVLGMLLLKFARKRYSTMKTREHQSYDTESKRLGSWGMTELDDEKRRHIFEDDPETFRKLKEKEKLGKEKAAAGTDFSKVSRYEMSAKRIW